MLHDRNQFGGLAVEKRWTGQGWVCRPQSSARMVGEAENQHTAAQRMGSKQGRGHGLRIGDSSKVRGAAQ